MIFYKTKKFNNMIFLLCILIILIDKISCIYDVYQLTDMESKLLIKILLRI
jgi:hypothetical protein